TLGAPRGTPIPVLADQRVGAAAAAADQQTAQQELAPVRSVEGIARVVAAHLDPDDLLPLFCAAPQLVGDDAEVRDLDAFPFLRRVWAGDPVPGARVFDIGAAVPVEPADIERIVEDTGAALRLAPQGGVAPGAAAGAQDTLAVQPRRDLPRTV